MSELNFQTSKKTYTVNGGAEISFDPADINFAKRLYDLLGKMEKRYKEPPQENPDNVFEIAVQRDKEMRSEIDDIFGEPICEKIFGTTNVFSPAGGAPLCMNFLMAIIDEIDAASATETKTSPQMAAYLKKYETKYGEYTRA